MQNRFRWLRTLLILAGVWSVAPVVADETVLRVGFAQDTLANDWRLAQVRELEREFAKYPQVKFVVTDGEGSTAKQISDIEELAHQGMDIIITSPRDSRAMTPAIAEIYRSGVPVVLITRGIVSEEFTTFVAPDDRDISRSAARYISEKLQGKGRVLMLQGVPTSSTSIARSEAFVEELKKYPGMELVATKVGNYLRSDAIRAVEEVVMDGITFDAIFAQSDSMASGARIALKKMGRDPAGLAIVGIDYIREAQEAILSGEQSASFTYPTSGRETVRAVMEIAAGRSIAKRIRVESQRVTRENAAMIEPIF